MADDPFKASRASSDRDELLLSIVYSLYRTIYEADRWPLILRQIQELLSARAFCLSTHDFRGRSGKIAMHSGCFREHDLVSYNRTWGICDPWLNHDELYATTGVTWIGDELVARSQFVISDFYREWLRPQDLLHQCSSVIFRDNEYLVYLRAYRAPHQSPFKRHELYPLQRLLPHLRQTLELHHSITNGRTGTRKSMIQAIEELGAADSIRAAQHQMLVNELHSDETAAETTSPPSIAVVQRTSNSPSEAGASSNDVLNEQPPLEAALSTDAPASFQARLAQRTIIENAELTKNASGKHGRRWLPVVLNTTEDSAAESDGGPNAPEQSGNEEQLKRLYSLTPSEARLAELLASGTDLPKAATLLGIGLSTVRTHLQRIYGKTDTHHQSELVALLLSGPAQLRVSYYRIDEEGPGHSTRILQQ